MDLELACSTASSVDETDSPSSVTAEPSISDSSEPLLPNENIEKEKIEKEERKNHRLARRKALALTKFPVAAPKLGKILTSANNTIDLTVEDDDPSNKWFKKTFAAQLAAKKKSPEGKNFAVPKNIHKSGWKREDMKKHLQASMSAKRRKDQEQRRKMYQEDNEHLQNHSDEEDEEEEIIRKKKKKKARLPKNEDEYNSEDDEDYNPEDSPAENSSDEEIERKKEEKADDEVSVNFMNDSFTFDVFNMKKRSGPGSTASSLDVRSQIGEIVEKSNMFGDVQIPEGTSGLFDLCADSFTGNGVQDTLQLLLNENKKKEPAKMEKSLLDENDELEEEEDVMKKKVAKSNTARVLDSDDEVEETPEPSETLRPHSYDIFESNESERVEKKHDEEVERPRPQRIVVSGDEDSESEVEEQEDEEIEDEEEVDPQEEEEEVPIPEPNFDDEDDELAVIKRIEYKEYSQKIKKKTLFDDEASLSGDDVGSDLEDEEGLENLYEAEEGDADDVPDDDTIRRENFKLMLKQDNAKEQRALAKLQDRLLADGDLGGVETNRQFRFKLREDVDVQMDAGDGNEDDQEDDEPEESEEAKKARAEMIKYKIEHAAELEMLDNAEVEEDDVFRRAGMMIKTVRKTVVESSEEIVIKRCIAKPSLLSKASLAASFQEVLGAGAAPKQMYVQNRNAQGTSSEPSRLSSGGVKRGRQSPEPSAAKRVRQGKLSALE